MKFHLATTDGNYLITGYDHGWVEINQQRYHHNLILMPDQVMPDWDAGDIASIRAEHFEIIAALKPEVVLLGTGARHQFIHPKLSLALTEIGVSLECMTTHAACRTYNILMAEGRNVAAALLI
jgi:uncharacterized protein